MFKLVIIYMLSVDPSQGLEFKNKTQIGYFNTSEGCEMFAERVMPQYAKLEFYKKGSMMWRCEKS